MIRRRESGVFLLIICIFVLVFMPIPCFAAELETRKNDGSMTQVQGQPGDSSGGNGTEEDTGGENPIYDNLQRRIKSEWDKGLESIEDAEVIKITGNPVERLLRGITASLYRNLKNIKAGALLIGTCSFSIGIIVAVSARKNKKARRFAVVALITVIPSALFIMTFCLAMLISMFT